MKGRKPKPDETRQRRNKRATAAELEPQLSSEPAVPSLPRKIAWHEQTKLWWHDVWTSPMAARFLVADRHALLRLAVLVNEYWGAPTVALGAEIRQQETRFGLTPLDRMRLQWTIQPVAPPKEQKADRELPARVKGDPRDALRLVQ